MLNPEQLQDQTLHINYYWYNIIGIMCSSTIRLQLEEKELIKAHKLAEEWGFSSVEEVLKEFIKRFLNKNVVTSSNLTQKITLTKKAKTRYKQMNEDFKIEKDISIAKSVDDFLAQLNA
ncbi:hypothetical protein KJ980_04095 [Patescibacteria group bacterium]|nr:hypothetical protein [Patescibacteria group bacterium]MBU4016364.1 hypothetical protein [Patescibacteria group bacterium]MBU4098806.1 hypothetical protein [Patescibacteria group bacterium]